MLCHNEKWWYKKLMKKLIIIFIILFSRISLASDDLTGNSLICKHDWVDSIRIFAYSFISEKEIIQLIQNSDDTYMGMYERWYHTTPTTIHVHYYWDGEIKHEHKEYYEVNRQTLKLTAYGFNYDNNYTEEIPILGFEGDECKLFYGNVKDTKEEILNILKKETDKNLL